MIRIGGLTWNRAREGVDACFSVSLIWNGFFFFFF